MTAGRPTFANLPAWPRLLRAEEAAAYLGMTRNSFDALVKQGTIHRPAKPLFGLQRRHKFWDRARLDQDVDRLFSPSGSAAPPTPSPTASGGPLDPAPGPAPRLPTEADAIAAAKAAHVKTAANANRANGNRLKARRHEGTGVALRHDAP